MAQLYNYTDYKEYIALLLEDGRGLKTRFSQAIQCKPSYLTQILGDKSHLSLEQADLANAFLGHNEEEGAYFICLVNQARAGTPSLRRIFEKQAHASREQHLNLKQRFGVAEVLSEKDLEIYYSSWHFSAAHMATLVPRLQTRSAMGAHLQLPPKRLARVLEFLLRTGLAKAVGERFVAGPSFIHLGKGSALATKNHVNWRLRSIASIENQFEQDLHYSSVLTISETDLQRAKEVLVSALEQIRAIIRDSADSEKIVCLLIDAFEI